MISVSLISDGTFKLDGGAMHGVVPRSLWQKANAPDEKNRILLGLNCLLVNTGKEKILIETGVGIGHSEKFSELYAIDKTRTLLKELAALRVDPEEIAYVIPTHLHFDHAGGLADWSTGKLLFPKAKVVIQKEEWEAALHPHPKNAASYLPEFLEPLKKASLEIVVGNREIVPGVRVEHTGGHTHGHQVVFVETGKVTIAYLGDLVPTAAHVNPLWAMAYDVEPEKSISEKKRLIKQGVSDRWTFVLVHDPHKPVGHVALDEKERYVYQPAESLSSISWLEHAPVGIS